MNTKNKKTEPAAPEQRLFAKSQSRLAESAPLAE